MQVLKEIKLEHPVTVKQGDRCSITIDSKLFLLNTKNDWKYTHIFEKEGMYTHMIIFELNNEEYEQSFGVLFVKKRTNDN